MKRWLAFLQSDAGSAVPLLGAAVLALVLANSPASGSVAAFLHLELAHDSLVHWIDDGLMVVFFLLVGMEIKREVVLGELSRPSQVALPIAGALGGILLPAAIYSALTWHDHAALTGWAIPSATDIAFAAALLSALGSRVPPGLRLFLLTLAIVDDLAAIAIIAVFYTAHLSTLALLLAGLCILVLVALNALGVKRMLPYLFVGILLWLCVLDSGVHATLAGVVLAFCLPLGDAYKRLEHVLRPWVLYLVLPLFAFANSGLDLGAVSATMVRDPIVIGIVAGLFLG
ncbi:MAG: Na+/H+ antiporter NhaA, partial [Reyranellales bacterium]